MKAIDKETEEDIAQVEANENSPVMDYSSEVGTMVEDPSVPYTPEESVVATPEPVVVAPAKVAENIKMVEIKDCNDEVETFGQRIVDLYDYSKRVTPIQIHNPTINFCLGQRFPPRKHVHRLPLQREKPSNAYHKY